MKLDTYKKYEVYNSLFLNLDYQNSPAIGYLIPILGKVAKKKLGEGINPIQIFDQFYDDYHEIIGEDKLDFMFKVIQYVERQVVLFDSVEDSVSPFDLEDQENMLIDDLMARTHEEEEKDLLLERLNAFKVRIVLTAHPTQFYRPPVLDIIAKLSKQIGKNNLEKIDTLLNQLGLTSLVNTQSPTPLDEAMNIIHICRYEYYDALGKFLYGLQNRLKGFDNFQLVSLGFWPCGDRDGNPFVTHEVTRSVIDALRMTLMKCYYKDLKDLRSKLTFKKIEPILLTCINKVYQAMFHSQAHIDHHEILENLQRIRQLLVEQYEALYLPQLDMLIVKVKAFQSHFASLDIRQDHSIHFQCIEQILLHHGKITASLDELEKEELIRLLTEEWLEIADEMVEEGVCRDTLVNIRQLEELQELNGEAGCHRYIISNSDDEFAVLFVLALFRWIYKKEVFSFDIIPLFETMHGMAICEQVMDHLYRIPIYRQHLASRHDQQTIMLGFSDGTKDGGYLKANWSIQKSKEVLSAISQQHDIDAVFFDGRGGPPARGGGKTHNFYAARSAQIANFDIQLTIQGQTITSTYGTADKFVFNAEQMVTSGLLSLHKQSMTEINDEARQLLESLSELSYEKYISLKNHPGFLPYLEEMSTLKYYARTKIGSRPGKRNKSAKLTLSDLRAIAYVGSWSQLKQNIPGFYGVGTALNTLKEAGKLDALKQLYKQGPLFRTLIDNCMMSLTKCYFELTSYIASRPDFKEFWHILHDEYLLSKKMVLEITEMESLMEGELRSKKSIQVRDEIVLPLLLVQHYALQRLNIDANEADREVYEKLVVRSLYGNINASRNSA